MATTKGLRQALAENPALRLKAQEAAARAAYQVVRDAGIEVTPDDIALAQQEVNAVFGGMPAGGPAKRDDAANTLAAGAVLVAVATGF